LSFGALWLVRRDDLGEHLLFGRFENAELAFVRRFLKPGMAVLDIGAHHGLYTLLASKQVGRVGKVFAFEPSPRERRSLRCHLILNHCWNVAVQPFAVARDDGKAELHVVQGSQTGCNSLRPPDVAGATLMASVRTVSLDSWVQRENVARVDFIKLDVEGAELEVLEGAHRLLERRPRPVALVEVQDVRTAPWGYRAREILRLLETKGYTWLELSADGSMRRLDTSREEFDGNFVACPEEVLESYYVEKDIIDGSR
jgi:FkbM family methyltransferase